MEVAAQLSGESLRRHTGAHEGTLNTRNQLHNFPLAKFAIKALGVVSMSPRHHADWGSLHLDVNASVNDVYILLEVALAEDICDLRGVR